MRFLRLYLILIFIFSLLFTGKAFAGGTDSTFTVTPDSLDFGEQELGTIIDSIIIITNNTDSPLECGIQIVDEDLEGFSISFDDSTFVDVSSFALLAGDSLMCILRFQPLEVGYHSASIEITYYGSNTFTDMAVKMSGFAYPGINLEEFDFQTINVGHKKIFDEPLIIRNDGLNPLYFNLNIAANVGIYAFSLDDTTWLSELENYTMPPNDSLRLFMRFTPKNTVTYKGNLQIRWGELYSRELSLEGTGGTLIIPSIADTIEANIGSPISTYISFINASSDPTDTLIIEVSMTTESDSIFTVGVDTLYRLAPDTLYIPLFFNPDSIGKSYDRSLIIKSRSVDTDTLSIEHFLTVIGYGTSREAITLQSEVNYSSVIVGNLVVDSSLLFTNAGLDFEKPLKILGLYNTQSEIFKINNIDLPLTIAPSDTQALGIITFAPRSDSTYQDTLIIITNDPDRDTLYISLIGRGLPILADTTWTFTGVGDVVALLTIPSIDGDTIPEIIVETYNQTNIDDHLFCLSGTSGIPIWSWGENIPGAYYFTGLLGDVDLNNDSNNDLILASVSKGNNTIYALQSNNGDELWHYDVGGWIYDLAIIEDLNNDGISEILFSTGEQDNSIYCLDGADGTLLWWRLLSAAVESIAILSDLDGDKLDDLVVGKEQNSNNTIVFLSSKINIADSLRVLGTYKTDESIWSLTTIENPTDSTVIAGCWNGTVYALEYEMINDTLQIKTKWEQPIIHSTQLPNVIAQVLPFIDLDGDGYNEILIAAWNSTITCLSGSKGEVYWTVPTNDDIWMLLPIEDINRDGTSDVLAAGLDGLIYCADGDDYNEQKNGLMLWEYNTNNKVLALASHTNSYILAGNQQLTSGGDVYHLAISIGGKRISNFNAYFSSGGGILNWDSDGFYEFYIYRQTLSQSDKAIKQERTGKMKYLDDWEIITSPLRELGYNKKSRAKEEGYICLTPESIKTNSYIDHNVKVGTHYKYLLGAIDEEGEERFFGPFEIIFEAQAEIPNTFVLNQNYPNPFNPITEIVYHLPYKCEVNLRIYNVLGQLVKTLVNEEQETGKYKMQWDGTDEIGKVLSSGIYFYRLEAGDFNQVKRMILLK